MSYQIAALALLDSLNILTLAIAVYLLGTPRPVPRTLAYVAGTALGYFTAGVLLVLGWRVLFNRFLPLLDPASVGLLQIVGGAALVIGGVHAILRPAREVVFRPPQHINPVATFLLGAVIGLLYAPTDPRHNMAIGLIVNHADSGLSQVGWLLWYNAFYVLPLLGLVVLRVVWPVRSKVVFGWLTDAISNFFFRVLPTIVAIIGLLLMVAGVWRIIRGG